MSMLAERRRKQRWSLNPRGKLWAEESNGFGQKMMQKMGWKHGKGLGANEDGIAESLKVSYKNDNKGMGYKEVEQWTAHDENFTSLLQTLNGDSKDSSADKKITSLEQKSQNSRARIHYHKFTKGKDLSRYSEKDIANIFGKKTLDKQDVKEEITPENDDNVIKEKGEETLINKGSMADYFKKKLGNFGKSNSNYAIGNNGVLTKEMSDSENERVGFGFGFSKRKREDEECMKLDDKKKKKRKEVDQNFVCYLYEDNEVGMEEKDVQEARNRKLEHQENFEEMLNVKKKKKQKVLLENFTSYVCEDEESRSNSEDVRESGKKSKKKKKDKVNEELEARFDEENGKQTKKTKLKKRKEESEGSDREQTKEDKIEVNEENVCGVGNQFEARLEEENPKEIKKRKLKKQKEENEDIERHQKKKNYKLEEENQIEAKLDEENHKETKKKKLKKQKQENEDVEGLQTETKIMKKNEEDQTEVKTEKQKNLYVDNSETFEELKNSKKLKKKKKSEDPIGISNPAFTDFNPTFNMNDSLQVEDKEEKVKRKKKKHEETENPYEVKLKKKLEENIGIDNPGLNLYTTDSREITENPYEVKAKRSEETGLDNPGLNVSDIILDTNLMLNVVNTPVILKKSIVTPELMSRIQKVRTRRKSVRFSDVLQEHIIPNDPSERINEYLSNRNELFDINTMVVEESIKEDMQKQGLIYENSFSSPDLSGDQTDISRRVVESSVQEELSRATNLGFVNNGFDIRSVDKVNFFECKYEVRSPDKGIDNKGFNTLKNQIEENVESISNTIDRYQAEVENDINETKAKDSQNRKDWLVGDVGKQIDRSMKVEAGSKLCFKEMHFSTQVPAYLRKRTDTAKRAYRHLIRGDITVAFKNSNLHEIKGYAIGSKKKT